MLPIFDGHNDVLLRLVRKGEADGGAASFIDGDGQGQLDLPRARAGAFAGGLFAVFVPSQGSDVNSDDREAMMRAAAYEVPLPPDTELTYAQAAALEMTALLLRIARMSGGAVRICRNTAEIRAAAAEMPWRPYSTSKAPNPSTPSCGCSKYSMRRACVRSDPSGAAPISLAMVCRSGFPVTRTPARG
jgi:hypothetical protein